MVSTYIEPFSNQEKKSINNNLLDKSKNKEEEELVITQYYVRRFRIKFTFPVNCVHLCYIENDGGKKC